MKRFLTTLFLAAIAVRAHADGDLDVRAFEYLDVIETTDGSVWKGVVVEQTPNVQYKVAIAGGSVHVIKATEVAKMSKQRNPEFRAAAPVVAPTEGGVATTYERDRGLPAPLAETGLRLEPELAIVFPTGDIDGIETSFAPSVRFGYEALFGNFGISGGGLARFTYWRLPGDTKDAAWTLESMAYGRAALHISRVAAYAGIALGVDTNYIYVHRDFGGGMDDVRLGLGANLQTGIEVLATPTTAFKLGFDYHPATDELIPRTPTTPGQSVEYYALLLGASLHI